ncbi:PolC-type DNA polymerase III [Cohnella sp.]|uniref:3'-5' exonuclease n=1 Tax=Cohnella sp. TaxID=1883426 RepID=UPI00356909BD
MKIKHISSDVYEVTQINIKDMLNNQYCIFDLEATGPNPEEAHVTQIGALGFKGFVIQDECRFSSLVHSPKEIPEKIVNLTGISNADISSAPVFSDVYKKFVNFIGDSILVTQAGFEFDKPLLKNECKRNGMKDVQNQMLDIKVLFTFLYPDIKEIISTNFLIRFYQIDDQKFKRHDAIGDCKLIGNILTKILRDFERRGITDLIIQEPLIIKKMKLQPLL